MARIEAVVAPNSRKFEVSLDPENRLRVRLTERAEGNKANLELVKKLSELLGAPVSIARGAASKRKTLGVGLDEDEVFKRIREAGKEG
ncbi:MAG: DUF167 domain-containing protein [Candidatus ainarchaeum sp.]|nr:DUF167 domain-containing protein [Candidatus ainarchaeum sp.]